jgi:two-component system, cell cycle sensor histidine kinase and response regulator CckA
MSRVRSLETVEIQDLLNLEEIQTVQDTFALIAQVSSVITDVEGRVVTRPTNTEVLDHPDGCARITVGDRHLANWYVAGLPGGATLEGDRLEMLCASLAQVAGLLSRQAMRQFVLQRALDARHEAENERDRLEDHLRQAAKLEALGRLAGGVAHDFNNLLTAIQGYSELLQMEVTDRPEAEEILQHLFGVTRRASDMVRGLLDFARKEQQRSEPVDINAVVREATSLLQRSLDPHVFVHHDLEPGDPVVVGDHTQIENAILNLCLNSRDAMPGGGRLQIATRTRELDTAACRLHPSIRGPGAFVEVSVTDNGVGMDAQTRERLFEPFFTTKQSGQGTGLGLAGVYSCVKAHRGGVDVASAPGAGTTITLYLPLAVGEVARPPDATPVRIVTEFKPGTQRRILVVDDEEPVRVLVQKVFTRAGHRVVACRDGVEALEIWRRERGGFDLVILDLVMPRLGGEDVLAAMLAQEPRTRVLVISGYSAGAPRDRVVTSGACGFLAKPFRPVDLLREAGRILAVTSVSTLPQTHISDAPGLPAVS